MKTKDLKLPVLILLISVTAISGCQKTNDAISERNQNLSLLSEAALVTTNTATSTEAPHWDYENPTIWPADYPECAGLQQSPVNIVTTQTRKEQGNPIGFNYQPFPFSIIDNGHTIQVNAPAGRCYITYKGQQYELKQFHFHRNSEHTINGSAREMEVHFVHRHPVTGVLTVLGVLLKEGDDDNSFVQKIWNNFPAIVNSVISTSTIINPIDMIPGDRNYFSYQGSLTTPPCSQGVNWVVFKKAKQISEEQVGDFPHHANFRPVQPLNGRIVVESQFRYDDDD